MSTAVDTKFDFTSLKKVRDANNEKLFSLTKKIVESVGAKSFTMAQRRPEGDWVCYIALKADEENERWVWLRIDHEKAEIGVEFMSKPNRTKPEVSKVYTVVVSELSEEMVDLMTQEIKDYLEKGKKP